MSLPRRLTALMHNPRATLFVVLFAVLAFAACCYPLMDTDFWWHLRTGELIWERGQLPAFDWYTYTDSQQPWIDLHYGFQLFITGIWHLGEATLGDWKLGGANLVVLVKATLYVAAMLIAMQATGDTLPAAYRVGFWILPVITISGRAYERPEMLSLLFLATWLWIVQRSESQPLRIWWTIPLQILWTNCHALSVLGLVTGGCYVADRLTRLVVVGRRRERRLGLEPLPVLPSLSLLLVFTAVLIGTAFLNPWFNEGAFFPQELYRKFSVDRAVWSKAAGEFQQPYVFFARYGFRNVYLNAEIALWMVTAVSFLFCLLTGRISLFRLLMFIGFSKLGWDASRNTSIFSLVAAAVLCANAAEFAGVSPSSRGETGDVKPPSRREGLFVLQGLVAFLMVGLTGLIVTQRWSDWCPEAKPFGLGEKEEWFAHKAIQFAGREGMPVRAITFHNGLACVYVYHHAPRCQVFMDARLEVTRKVTYARYEAILTAILAGDVSWAQLLRDETGRLPVMIFDARFSKPAIVQMLNTSGVRLVYADHEAAVFLEEVVASQLKLPPADPRPIFLPVDLSGKPW